MPRSDSRPTPQRRSDSRERILLAASEEFARHGFAGARIDTIAARTQLNVRMIYYHFQSKEGLYQAVLEDIYREMAGILDEAESTGPAEVALQAFGRYIDLLGSNPRFADILIREAIDGGQRLVQMFREHPTLYGRIHRRAHDMLQQTIDAGVLRRVDTALVVHSLTGMICLLVAARGAQSVFLDGRQVSPAEWKESVLDLLLHGLAVKPP